MVKNQDSLMPRRDGGLDLSQIPSLLGSVRDCIEVLDRGATERKLIRAKRDTVCIMLRERLELMVSYLNYHFGERSKLYDEYFRLIDKAMKSENDEVTRIALESLLQVYSSPIDSSSRNFMPH